MAMVDHTAHAARTAAASRARLRTRCRMMCIIVAEPLPGWKGKVSGFLCYSSRCSVLDNPTIAAIYGRKRKG
jgi:hypothetical protein